MSHFISNRAFNSLILGIFIFFVILQINFFIIYQFLTEKGISNNESDFIEIVEILGVIISGFVLIQLINLYSKEKIIVISLFIYLICMLCFTITENSKVLTLELVLMSTSRFIFCAVSLIKLIKYFEPYIINAISLFFFLWTTGYIIADFLIEFLTFLGLSNITLLMGFILSLITLNMIFSFKFLKITNKPRIEFSKLTEMIELEILAGFITGYIAFTIYWNHEIFALNRGFNIFAIKDVRFYMICGVLTFIYPLKKLSEMYNKYKLNIAFMITLLLSFVLFQNSGSKYINNLLIHFIIGGNLYILFSSNLIILADKFEDNEFVTSILIYFTMSMIGGYIGMIVTDNIIETFNANGFLTSIYSVIIIFLIYYLLQFFTRRLYKS